MNNRLIILNYEDKFKNLSSLKYSLEYFKKMSSEIIIIGKNVPSEFSSYKIFESLSFFSELKKYNQIIFLKNEFYGTFYTFDKIFEKMQNFDFWTLDKIFLQTKSFFVFNRNIIQHPSFEATLLSCDFRKKFEEQGFSFGTFSEDVHKIDVKIKNGELPIIHKSYFFKEDYKLYNYRVKTVFNYLKNKFSFDTDLILKDMILCGKAHLIPKNIHLNYLLQDDLQKANTSNKKVALIMFIHPEELIEECREYAGNLPENVDLFIVSTSDFVLEKCKEYFSKIKNRVDYRLQKNRGRDNTALLVTCRDVILNYDYICFTHAKQSLHQGSDIIGEDFRNHCFHSLLSSKGYINNIINTLEDNKLLGILAPFPPNFQPYVTLGDEWMKNLDNAKEFIKIKISKDIKLSENNPICTFGGMFWAKSSALMTLLSANLTFEDFPEEPINNFDGLLTHTIERIIPALAQNDGFYTSFVAPVDYGVIYLDNVMNDFKILRKVFLQSENEK